MAVKILTGNYSVAEAVKQARVEVIAAYPITPQTAIVEALSSMVRVGDLKASYLRVESEHSAMAACIGASSVGVRTFTATSSHGLAYMHELLYWASASRLPIVMVNVNRALGPPWNIWAEHTDSLIERDTGWIQLYASSNQEAYDLIFQAYKLAECKDILLPVMICIDGFLLSHTSSPVSIIEQEKIDNFLPSYKVDSSKQLVIDVNNPETFGNIVPSNVPDDKFYEFRYLAHEAMLKAELEFIQINNSFKKITGRDYGGLIYKYQCEDAELILVSMGTLYNQCVNAVNILRNEGLKIGAIKITAIRPFPISDLKEIVKKTKTLLVIDRDLSYGIGGMLAWEIKSAIQDSERSVNVFPAVAGIGGRDISAKEIIKFVKGIRNLMEKGKSKKDIYWIGLRRGFIGKDSRY